MDVETAVQWYRQGHAAGSVAATCGLGFLMASGIGMPRQIPEALVMLKECANATEDSRVRPRM